MTSEFKAAGDVIYLLGKTYDELGGSELYTLFGELGANVPKVRKEQAKQCYLKVMQANKQRLIESSHDLSDGGLAVALAESTFGTNLGVEITIDPMKNLRIPAILFSESHSRFLVSIQSKNRTLFESIMGEDAVYLGVITEESQLIVRKGHQKIIDLPTKNILDAWDRGLEI